MIIHENVAFIEATVKYDPGERLNSIRQQLKEAGVGPAGSDWLGCGGASYDYPFEKDGIGLNTLCFVKEKNHWVFHMSRLTVVPLSDSQLDSTFTGLKNLS